MSDRELLYYAAKAVGIEVAWPAEFRGLVITCNGWDQGEWNPLTDDADAFRLMVDLNLDIVQFAGSVRAIYPGAHDWVSEDFPVDCPPRSRQTATRRAIVRAAAELAAQPSDC